MKREAFVVSVLICTVTVLLFVPSVFAEALLVYGSTTCKSRFLDPGASGLEKATGIKLQTVGVGTGQGLIALLEGKAEVSAASEDMNDAVASAKQYAASSGKKITIPDNLMFHKITEDEIIVIVHKDNPVKALTWKQLKAIHTGEIKNWKEVGGSDMPIKVVTSHDGSATRMFFQKVVMGNAAYTPQAAAVDATAKEIFEVSKDKGAIGAVSLSFLLVSSWETKKIETDRIIRPLGLITKGKPSPKVQRLIDYFTTGEGQKIVKSPRVL